MADEVDVLLKFCDEEWTQCRQSENQRSTVSNFIITITAATLAFIGNKGFVIESLPMAIFLVILGLYGTLTSAKLYERWLFSRNRARGLYKRIDELKPNAQLIHLRTIADSGYTEKLRHVRLHWFWLSLHILITLLGVVCIVWILI